MDAEYRKSRLFFLFVVVISAYLIVFFQDYTVDVKRNHGWFTKPYVAPLFGLGVLFFFSLIKLLLVIRPVEGEKSLVENMVDSLMNHRVVVMTAILFYVYIHAITMIGFVLSTLLFVLSIVWLSRLLSPLWALNTVFAVTIITLVFRVGVNIWIPDVALYEALFSGETLWFMNKYF